MKKIKELASKTKIELEKYLNEKRKELANLKFKKNLKTLKKTHLLKQTKKEIARILTLLNKK